MTPEKIRVAIVGLGSRGKDVYAKTAKLYPEKMEITAIADILPEKVDDVAKEYGIAPEMCFPSAEALLEQERLADLLVVSTQDRQHVPHAIPALRKGYHILLEKPISPELAECKEIVKVAQECNRRVVVCHVLRYTPYYSKLKEVLDSGVIGDVVAIQALEQVGYWHQAHSFVRGNWRDSGETSPMILAKCCHDMDLYLWLASKTCKTVSSFGSTYLFKEAMAPEGAALRCMDGCKAKEGCPFDAEKIYITNKLTGIDHNKTGWPNNILALHPTKENIREAVKTSQYGRCVYHCDNNVVDHQVLSVEMTDGSTMSFTMSGLTEDINRQATFMGTLGEIVTDMDSNLITVRPFGKEKEVIDVSKIAKDFSGHGGGDNRMVEEFLDILLTGSEPGTRISSVEQSVQSHLLALGAEKSRLMGGAPVELSTL